MKNIFYLLLLFVFASCGGDDEPTPETTNTSIVPNVGVGEITFEDDGNAVVAAYGDYSSINANRGPDGTNFAIWYNNGLAFQLAAIDLDSLSLQEIVNMANDLVDLNQKVIQIIVMSPFAGETAEEIKLGSSKAEVVSAYGDADKIGSLTENYDELNTNFWYSSVDSTVTRMDLQK